MTFLLQRCGTPARTLDIDAVWGALGEMVRNPDPPSPPGEETSDGARLGFVIGIRLALDDPGLARIVMGRYERCVNEDGEPYERDEEILRDLVGGLLDLITVRRGAGSATPTDTAGHQKSDDALPPPWWPWRSDADS
jgi:hypothetical protein